ncbi:MAG: type II secretion system GspH family protein [Candidatus Omnitrophica bacterium]|nr:type II secretion system GspH family protein [Candidatus Omnitrophota bacterium]
MKPRTGFTLVELLVSVTLVAMITGVTVSIVMGGFRVWDRWREYSGRHLQVRLALEEFSRDLRNMHRFRPIPLDGRYDQISFPALLEFDTREGKRVLDIGRVAYFFNDAAGTLSRSEHSYRGLSGSSIRDGEKIIVEGIDRVRFFFYKPEAMGGTGWTDAWDEKEENFSPQAIKLEIGYTPYDKKEMVQQSVVVIIPTS